MRSNTPIEKERYVPAELKALRLHGMAGASSELMEQGGGVSLEPSRWLIEHLLQAEDVDRHMRSIAQQMKAVRFPVHRDLAGFDFEVSPKTTSKGGHQNRLPAIVIHNWHSSCQL